MKSNTMSKGEASANQTLQYQLSENNTSEDELDSRCYWIVSITGALALGAISVISLLIK